MSLFNKKYIAKQIAVRTNPDVARLEALTKWSEAIKSGRIAQHKEVALHGEFLNLMVQGFGYQGPVAAHSYTITQEKSVSSGAVDLAIGEFSEGAGQIIAPFELKGADTKNLDAIMPGRAKTPVDQVWEYATKNAGTKWVLISNYLEIRLYSYGDGRQEFESFDLAKLHEPEEFARAQLLLSAENLLSGKTSELLAESKQENKDITERLYKDYKTLRTDLIGEVSKALPDLDPLLAIRTGQKILDRILFIAFAEDTITNGVRLLPHKSIENAYKHTDPYNPRPVWETFQSLFNAIDTGLPTTLNIPKYNGGLFAPDEIIQSLSIRDEICQGFKRLSEYDFASEVSVTVLGHIFEQSIADVEQLQAEARGEAVEAKKTTGTSGRRKRDGVVYTPDYIARFIVEQTLGTHCREIFTELLAEHAKKGATPDDDPIAWKNDKAEKQFWLSYRERISKLRIVDPACGSGVFLVMAFDWLKAELLRCNTALEKLGEGALFEVDSEILTHNLFGVDVNEESVEIAKLSLWIKTARHGKVLDSLDDNFRVGDSLIEDSSYAYRSHGFVWKDAFKDIFAEGGFDIVLGNPPYVRQELLRDVKPWLASRYLVYDGAADLFSYFFEKGIDILKPEGRMGYISSSSFFKTGSGEPLRNFLRTKTAIENVVDFGDDTVFEGVTTYPAILTFRKVEPPTEHQFRYLVIDDAVAENFQTQFDEQAKPAPQSMLNSGSWELEDPAMKELRAKLLKGTLPLKKVYGSPHYGIKTGRNEAFVVDRETRDRLVSESPSSAEVIRPWIEGKDAAKWRVEFNENYLIFFPKGFTRSVTNLFDTEDAFDAMHRRFPAVMDWLKPHQAACEKRSDQGDFWWELRACDYYDVFEKGRIIYPEISQGPKFSFYDKPLLQNKTLFSLPCSDKSLIALLNSKVAWFYFGEICTALRGGVWRLLMQSIYVETLPIPPATDAQKAELASLAEAAQTAAEKRYALQQEITRRIPDLANGPATKLTERLKSWWNLPDFAAFQAEVKKALKTEIPLKQRNEWENWITENRTQIHALTAEIARIEGEINAKVYALFDLTPEEIELLEANI